ncbi:hypothetical protein L7F22_051663 [Adiantum nelumboides]|nr:hypothetical protein [Adiantum nelumboides]
MDSSDKSEEEEEHKMEELSVSFFKMGASPTSSKPHLHHPHHRQGSEEDMVISPRVQASGMLKSSRHGASFSCLSVAAIGANATLANTGLGNGLLRQEILPGLDSPKSFRPLEKSPSLSNIEYLMSSSSSSIPEASSRSAPQRLETQSFLSATDAQTAGGAAGEDRVQAVCSEEDGWLFCAIYDGFNGRDAADFLAGTLYENISHNLTQLVLQTHDQKKEHQEDDQAMDVERKDASGAHAHCHKQQQDEHQHEGVQHQHHTQHHLSQQAEQRPQHGEHHHQHQQQKKPHHEHHRQEQHDQNIAADEQSFRDGVLKALRKALMETEAGFMEMVQQDMEERPDLVMVGSCVLVVLLYGSCVYTMSLGDSRAVMATTDRGGAGEGGAGAGEEGSSAGAGKQAGGAGERGPLRWVQLTQDHVLAERSEKERVLAEHPDDPHPIIADRVKGKIKLTRAFGAGYLKKAHLNEKLMGLLRVPNLSSPPYISAKPHLNAHKVCLGDQFVVMGSDGLFDFFSNDEVVSLLHSFMLLNPSADPAHYMLDQLLLRAADSAGMTLERLRNIQFGRRRAYHDDVTIMVVTLGAEHHTSSASTVS